MLVQLLKIIGQGSYRSQLDIARQMSISPGMVAQLAHDLARRGYLDEASSDCSTGDVACAGCAAGSACGMVYTIWSLTEKGRQAISGPAAFRR